MYQCQLCGTKCADLNYMNGQHLHECAGAYPPVVTAPTITPFTPTLAAVQAAATAAGKTPPTTLTPVPNLTLGT
jgi:hypothetical protein